jgi:hypothetical protein
MLVFIGARSWLLVERSPATRDDHSLIWGVTYSTHPNPGTGAVIAVGMVGGDARLLALRAARAAPKVTKEPTVSAKG